MLHAILKYLKRIAKLSFRIFFNLSIKMSKNSQTWTYPVKFEG